MGDIERHLTSNRIEDTLYYTTSGAAEVALIGIDIDAHEGQTNAWDVA
jgi:hypothetical protein